MLHVVVISFTSHHNCAVFENGAELMNYHIYVVLILCESTHETECLSFFFFKSQMELNGTDRTRCAQSKLKKIPLLIPFPLLLLIYFFVA